MCPNKDGPGKDINIETFKLLLSFSQSLGHIYLLGVTWIDRYQE